MSTTDARPSQRGGFRDVSSFKCIRWVLTADL